MGEVIDGFKIVKPRKVHICAECGKRININEECITGRNGSAGTYWVCLSHIVVKNGKAMIRCNTKHELDRIESHIRMLVFGEADTLLELDKHECELMKQHCIKCNKTTCKFKQRAANTNF